MTNTKTEIINFYDEKLLNAYSFDDIDSLEVDDDQIDFEWVPYHEAVMELLYLER